MKGDETVREDEDVQEASGRETAKAAPFSISKLKLKLTTLQTTNDDDDDDGDDDRKNFMMLQLLVCRLDFETFVI